MLHRYGRHVPADLEQHKVLGRPLRSLVQGSLHRGPMGHLSGSTGSGSTVQDPWVRSPGNSKRCDGYREGPYKCAGVQIAQFQLYVLPQGLP